MTIAEQFEEEYNPITTCMSSVKNAIERIEARIAAQQLAMDVMALHIAALEHPQDAKPQGREWIEPVDVMFWCLWDDGEITVEDILGLCVWNNDDKNLQKVMPYIEGEPKPDAPEGK